MKPALEMSGTTYSMNKNHIPVFLKELLVSALLQTFNPLNTELNPKCHLLALLGAHHILHDSRIRVNCGDKTCTENWMLHIPL